MLKDAILAMRILLASDQFFLNSDVVVGCEPIWLCLLAHVAFPTKKMILRLTMCPTVEFAKLFDAPAMEFFKLFKIVLAFGGILQWTGQVGVADSTSSLGQTHHGSGRSSSTTTVSISASTRLSSESAWHMTRGRRVVYVPMLGFAPSRFQQIQWRWSDHGAVDDHPPGSGQPEGPSGSPGPSGSGQIRLRSILVFRSNVSYQNSVVYSILDYLHLERLQTERRLQRSERSETSLSPPLRQFVKVKKNLDFSVMARFLAVVLFPHVPNASRLSDMQGMGIPIMVPDEPFVYRTVWPMSAPYCGSADGADEWTQCVAPLQWSFQAPDDLLRGHNQGNFSGGPIISENVKSNSSEGEDSGVELETVKSDSSSSPVFFGDEFSLEAHGIAGLPDEGVMDFGLASLQRLKTNRDRGFFLG